MSSIHHCIAVILSMIFTLHVSGGTLEPGSPEPNSRQWKWGKHGLEVTSDPCSIPVPYEATSWKTADFEGNVKTKNKGASLVFLGDSITDLWEYHPKYQNGAKLWKEHYVPMGVENFAISGDRTENVLWQLTDGAILKEMSPRVIVLTLGINNVMRGDAPSSIATGIANILKVIHHSHPATRVLLCSVLPTCMNPGKETATTRGAQRVNELISKLGNGNSVVYLDVESAFLDGQGNVDSKYFYDGLHLTEAGFETWNTLLLPKIEELLRSTAK
ncbi:MAG: GDSL-type esterase/lipase family protein [Candidatus Hydrogenedentes bacterium]|nr:GDSL-type esterase/lipase family protein [Candidatus Hydrogenedentota bacterium]